MLGLREPPSKVRTFKIERLRSAEIMREEYELPEEFKPGELLRHAWGIWYTKADPAGGGNSPIQCPASLTHSDKSLKPPTPS